MDPPSGARPQREPRTSRGRGRGRGFTGANATDAGPERDTSASDKSSDVTEGASHEGKGRGSHRGRGRGKGNRQHGGDDTRDHGQNARNGRGGRGRGNTRDETPTVRGFGAGTASPRGRGRGRGDGSVVPHTRERTISACSNADTEECIICCGPLTLTAIGTCQHTMCHTCAIRIRFFADKKKKKQTPDESKAPKWPCPVCRISLTTVLVTEDPAPTYDYSAIQYLPHNQKWGMRFDSEDTRATCEKVLSLMCPVCPPQARSSGFGQDWQELKRHMSRDHEKFLCELCVEAQTLFPFEHKIYSRKELVAHKRSAPNGRSTHPNCAFCDTRFFDSDALAEHLHRSHEMCPLCDREGKPDQYFRNYRELETHFSRAHYLCKDPGCREKTFVVFSSLADLRAHEAATHKIGPGGRINVTSLVGGNGNGGRRERGGGAHGGSGRKLASSETASGADAGVDGHEPIMNVEPPPDLFSGPTLQQAATNPGVAPAPSDGSHGNRGGAGPPPSWVGGHATPMALSGAGASLEEAFPSLGGGGGTRRPVATGNGRSTASMTSSMTSPMISSASSAASATSWGTVTARDSAGGSLSSGYPTTPAAPSTRTAAPRQSQPQAADFPSLGGRVKTSAQAAPSRAAAKWGAGMPPPKKPSGPGRTSSITTSAYEIPGMQPRAPRRNAPTARELNSADNFPGLGGAVSVSTAPSKKSKRKKGKNADWTEAASKAAFKNSLEENVRKHSRHGLIDAHLQGGHGAFVPPDNLKHRNKALIGAVKALCGAAKFDEFKKKSGGLRRGEVSPQEFYELCSRVLKRNMHTLFPELVVLLPDVAVQQALYVVAWEHENDPNGLPTATLETLSVCPTTGQIIHDADLASHTVKLSTENDVSEAPDTAVESPSTEEPPPPVEPHSDPTPPTRVSPPPASTPVAQPEVHVPPAAAPPPGLAAFPSLGTPIAPTSGPGPDSWGEVSGTIPAGTWGATPVDIASMQWAPLGTAPTRTASGSSGSSRENYAFRANSGGTGAPTGTEGGTRKKSTKKSSRTQWGGTTDEEAWEW
eukprot:m.787985 g.787985  ORF g.787985 m.787985 type:complete len:1045 (-) comp23310_c0_seq4:405-3539(-)